MGQEIVNYDEQWAAAAKVAAAEEPAAAGTFLSTKGGILKCGEDELPGNQACVIILDAVRENTLYEGKFDQDNVVPPKCYAFGRTEEEMGPHESMQVDLDYFVPQAEGCKLCPHNVWGSAEKGRGKACQNRRRLMLIPAGLYIPKPKSKDLDLEIFTDPGHFQNEPLLQLKLSPTSVKNWAQYVAQLAASVNRPPHGVITKISLEPHPEYQYMIHFEMVEQVPNELASIIMARHAIASNLPFTGYQPPREVVAPQPGGSLKDMRRAR